MSVDSADSNYSLHGARPQLMSMGIYKVTDNNINDNAHYIFLYNSDLKKVNLGTRFGQRMHSLHMLILPLIPIFILLVQNGIKYGTTVLEADEILNVQRQVHHFNGVHFVFWNPESRYAPGRRADVRTV